MLRECILPVLEGRALGNSATEKILENIPGVTTNGECRDKTDTLVLISGSRNQNKKK